MAHPADIVQVALLITVMVLSLVGNISIVYVIVRVRRLHCPTGFLLVNLAVIDVMVTLTLLPLRIPGMLSRRSMFNEAGCIVMGFLQNALSYASVLTLLAVSFDRYLAIVLPLRYKSRVTGKRTAIVIGCLWAYSVLTACYPFFGWGNYTFIPGLWLCDTNYVTQVSFNYFKLCTIYFIPLMIISYLYYCIFTVSRRHSKQIRREVQAMNFRENSASAAEIDTQVGKINDVSGQFCLRKPHSAFRSEVKTALTLGFVVGALFLSWTPYIVLSLCASFVGKHESTTTIEVSSFLYYLNVMLNPYLYGYLNRTIKSQLKKYCQTIITRCSILRVRTNKVTPSIIVIAPDEETRTGGSQFNQALS